MSLDNETVNAIERNCEQINQCYGLDPRHKLLIQMVRELVDSHRELSQGRSGPLDALERIRTYASMHVGDLDPAYIVATAGAAIAKARREGE